MLLGSFKKGRSIKGFERQRILEPKSVDERHAVLVQEMFKRGFNHRSLLDEDGLNAALDYGSDVEVDVDESEQELSRRCPECRKRIASCTERQNEF